MGSSTYKPSERSWPGGQRAAGNRWAARLEEERSPSPPNAPRSDPTSPARTRISHVWKQDFDAQKCQWLRKYIFLIYIYFLGGLGYLYLYNAICIFRFHSPLCQNIWVKIAAMSLTSISSCPGIKMRMSPISPLRWICRACFTAAST